MTEVVVYRCTRCAARFGPMGFHGWDPSAKSGELPMACAACKTIFVGRFVEGKHQGGCPGCEREGTVLGPVCPACGEAALVFGDLRMPGFERPVAERPVAERPVAERPGSERSDSERPGSERPDSERPDSERS